jgi:hypothetical protein
MLLLPTTNTGTYAVIVSLRDSGELLECLEAL